MKNYLLVILLLAVVPAFGQQTSTSPASYSERKLSVGVFGTYKTVGLQADYRFASRWGVKVAGARQFDYDRESEYGLAGIGLLTYYLPTNSKVVEPLLGLGTVRSSYHWALAGQSGTVTDWNVGGGFGTNFRFSERFKTGLNVLLVNGFRAEYNSGAGDMLVTGRRLVVFPALTLDALL
ncbi:hypothetical protein [Hymenobacter sp. YC55]|uniref:hypothetical protein n=1 Tax=Hymenobacter sp. YC55 TaxID=3034019 RepID=UPI0023F7B336|nr:hypothetical protein [Hymenobacter sp. YC55]MDF7811826.1 hypothetical protein [Hymenobacter sp. YC55]